MRPIRSGSGLVVSTALLLMIGACGDSASPVTTTTTVMVDTTTTIPQITTSTLVTTTTPSSTVPVLVAFATGSGADCSEVSTFERGIDPAADPVDAAFEVLVAGPNAEEESLGAGSFFSEETADVLRSVHLYGGLLLVDFVGLQELISNASTSCGSMSLLAQLNTTAFQFDEVERVRYQIDGSCDSFSNWLQRDCVDYSREGEQPVSTNDRAIGSGCTPGSDDLPDGRWFGYVVDAARGEVEFDLACWFSLPAAADAATEDGEESPPPNDYYIRNQNEATRIVQVATGTEVTWLPSGDPADVTTGGFDDWVAGRTARPYLPGVWIEVDQGLVVSIEEQYVP